MVFGNNMLLPDLDWPGTHYAVQGEFEFMILLPQYPHPIPHCWDHRHVPPCPAVHSPSVPIQPTVNYRLHCILLQSWSQSQHKGSVKQVFPGLMGPLKYTSLCQQYNKNGKKKKKMFCSLLKNRGLTVHELAQPSQESGESTTWRQHQTCKLSSPTGGKNIHCPFVCAPLGCCSQTVNEIDK